MSGPVQPSYREIVTEIDTTTGKPGPSIETTAQPGDEPLEIEVVDDTPAQDRGKARSEPPPDDIPQGIVPSEDELKTYSESVQKRFKRMTYEFHEQRRGREAAERQVEEAARVAKQLYEDNIRMRQSMKSGEQALVQTSKSRIEALMDTTRDKLRKAHLEGDTEALIKAQEDLSTLQAERMRIDSYQPQYQNDEPPQIQPPPQKVQAPTVDPKAQDWAAKNSWFQKDSVMTGTAFGAHQKIVTEMGIDPRREPDAYYSALDRIMRESHPTYAWPENEQAQRKQVSSVVAPATRTVTGSSNGARKISLTASQVALAKRLGVTPQQYAAEMLKQAQQS